MKNKGSFFIKLFAFFIVNSLLLAVIFFIAANAYIKSSNVELFSRELQTNAVTIIPFLASDIEKKDYAALKINVADISKRIGNRITVIDLDGIVIADSQNDPSSMANHAGRDEIKAVLGGNPFATAIRYSSTLHENMLYAAVPFETQKGLFAVLRLSTSLKNIDLFTKKTVEHIFLIFLVSAFISFFTAFIMSRKMTRGIESLSEAALSISQGDFTTKAEIFANDEIGALAVSFNAMSDKIDSLFKEINNSKGMLGKILSSVSDGIILADKDGKVLLVNEAMKKMFPDSGSGRFIWEFLRNKDFEDALKTVSGGENQTLIGEIEYERSAFSYAVSKVKDEDRLVVMLRDVTKIKEFGNLKKEFIINASHELKTPVTSIAGFAETIETQDLPEETAHYIGIIKKQAERLSNIVNDLLSISALEVMKEIDMKEVDVAAIIRDAANLYKKRAAEKGLEIKIDISSGLKKAYVNEFNMEQLFSNLIDNAVKYTETGAITVKAGNLNDDFIKVSVSDTGIGIPKSQLSRIFERFYVVDKARSKKTGGTGLGLSIVKHILNVNGGDISAESEEGKGTTFTVRLPAAK
ncbi:MAG: ATP-binding protein [Endomicrobia bacterium]|nr:ATP-binding protein [Endomicrobiia bacterium]MCL2506106.1 ATP-binding protein [Endomicrobiia bacterium]